jgi:hypothetical protein
VLKALHQQGQIPHTGVSLSLEGEKWAQEQGTILTVSHGIGYKRALVDGLLQCMYGTSEMAPLLISCPGETLFRPLQGASGMIVPYVGGEDRPGQVTLYELVLPSDAPDGPQPSFCSDDGFCHPGDLFEPQTYVFRGRTGDLIKIIEGMCDPKYSWPHFSLHFYRPRPRARTHANSDASNGSIEVGVRSNCGDLIHDVVVVVVVVVVVSQMRPAPCMFVEAGETTPAGSQRTRRSISRCRCGGADRRVSEDVQEALFPF